MSERHAPLRDGEFTPFEWCTDDWNFTEFADRLRLRALQRELMDEVLQQLEIKIWFWDKRDKEDDHRHDPPGLELIVFMPAGRTRDPEPVSTSNLFEMLRAVIMRDWLEIDNEREIEVLEKLKALCDEGIAHRKREI